MAIDYLFSHRPQWKPNAGIGKTLVSSSIIDRVAASLKRKLLEVPVGSSGLWMGCWMVRSDLAARRAPARRSCSEDGSPWSTDKDGLILGLLAAEITAKLGKDPGQRVQRT